MKALSRFFIKLFNKINLIWLWLTDHDSYKFFKKFNTIDSCYRKRLKKASDSIFPEDVNSNIIDLSILLLQYTHLSVNYLGPIDEDVVGFRAKLDQIGEAIRWATYNKRARTSPDEYWVTAIVTKFYDEFFDYCGANGLDPDTASSSDKLNFILEFTRQMFFECLLANSGNWDF